MLYNSFPLQIIVVCLFNLCNVHLAKPAIVTFLKRKAKVIYRHECKKFRENGLDLTDVVICEAHSHKVFGWGVVVHLVTSVNTPFL